MAPRDLSHLRLLIISQGEEGARKLLLRKAEEEVSLVLAGICRALQYPPAPRRIIFVSRVMPGCDAVGTDLPRGQQQLVKLQVVVAKRARHRRTASQIFVHKRPHHVAL